MFALIDSNNFYASCHRLFEPQVEAKPIIVLSNNDGCVIAASDEAKKLGIKRGVPAFKIRSTLITNEVQVFSANFALYGDISRRINAYLKSQFKNVEQYSVDETFIFLKDKDPISHNPKAQTQIFSQVKNDIQRNQGIPVSIGIASTKTLAKLANKLAKKFTAFNGVCNFSVLTQAQIDKWLEQIPAKTVWGIGSTYARLLESQNILTAQDLKHADHFLIREQMSVMEQRTILELNGIECYPFQAKPKTKQAIGCSRSFGQKITTLQELQQAICAYTSRAAEKLRALDLTTHRMKVFIRTNGYDKDKQHYSNVGQLSFDPATSYSPTLCKYAAEIIQHLFKPGYEYYKAGIILSKLQNQKELQLQLVNPINQIKRNKNIQAMQAIDAINAKWGKESIKPARQCAYPDSSTCPWEMKQFHKTPAYTTAWSDLRKIDRNLIS